MSISRTLAVTLLLALVAFCLAGPAQQPSGTPTLPPEVSELVKRGEPTSQHRELDTFVGTWNQSVRCWVRPDAPAMESSMTATYEWVLDRRFIQGRISGSMFGRPFLGLEIRGFDAAIGCFTLQWMDNLGTTALLAAGQFDAQARVFTMNGSPTTCESSTTPQAPPPVRYRTVTHLVGMDRMIFEIFSRTGDGQEFRSLQVISARTAQ